MLAAPPSGAALALSARNIGTLLPFVVWLTFVAAAIRSGAAIGGVATAALVVLVVQVVPGVMVWRSVRPRQGWWIEDLAMGFAIGSVLAIGSQIVAGLTGFAWFSVLVATATVAVLLAVPATRERIAQAETSPLPAWFGPLIAAAMLVCAQALRSYFRDVPLDWSSGARVRHVDADLHLALATQLLHRGPTTFPWVESEALGYHWFSHAWVAQLSAVSGASLDDVLFRFTPVLMPLVVIGAVAAAAVRLSGRPWAGPLAAVLTIAGGDFNPWNRLTPGYPIAPLSPSLALAAPMLVALVLVLALKWRKEIPLGAWVLVPILAVGAAGTKGSTVPLVLAGLGLACLAMAVVDRRKVPMVAFDLGVIGVCLVATFATVFRGSGAGLHLDFAGAAQATPVGKWLGGVTTPAAQAFAIVATLLGVGSRASAALLPLGRPAGRRDPVTWLLLGVSVAGTCAVGIFAHPGSSQFYFARSAAPVMAIGSAIALAAVADEFDDWRPVLRWGAAGGVFAALGPYVLIGGIDERQIKRAALMLALAALAVVVATIGCALQQSERRWQYAALTAVVAATFAGGAVVANTLVQTRLLPPLEVVDASRPYAVSAGQIEAARWIRDHSDVDDLVMTNRHCVGPTPPASCDNRRFVVAAYTERQVLVEGWTPAPRAQEIAPEGRDSITVDYWYPELLELNDRFIAEPAQADAEAIRELGVRWVFVDHSVAHAASLEPFAVLRFQADGVDVYELTA